MGDDAGKKTLPLKTTGRLSLTDVGTMLGVCVSGAGIAQVMALGINDLLEQGKLINLFPDWAGEKFPLYALYPSRYLPTSRVCPFRARRKGGLSWDRNANNPI